MHRAGDRKHALFAPSPSQVMVPSSAQFFGLELYSMGQIVNQDHIRNGCSNTLFASIEWEQVVSRFGACSRKSR
jgi:hypothetical protein